MTNRPTRSQLRRHARRLSRDGYQPMMVINSGTTYPRRPRRRRPRHLALPLRTRPHRRRRGDVRSPRTTLHRAHPPIVALAGANTLASDHGSHAFRHPHGRERHGPCSTTPPNALYAVAVTATTGGWLTTATATRPGNPADARHRRHPHHRLRHPLVGQPSPSRQGPRRSHARRLAGDRQRDRPTRIADHVRPGRRLGLAGQATPGPRPDDQRRDHEDPAHRIRTRHLPRSRPRLPDPRRPRQPMRATSPRHRPPRRRHPVARPVNQHDHGTDRPRPVRRRRTRAASLPTPTRPVRRRDRRRQEQRSQRPDGQPGRMPRRGHLGHRPQEGHGAWPVGTAASTVWPPHPTKPARSWPTRSRSSRQEPPCSPSSGQRVWQPTPDMPALVIVIDEYAELSDDAPDAIKHADSIARRGRAVAVNLVAATQRPTQKAMGQGAVRSQMDVRISFRVRERKDVDLILGQGMLAAGWHAHTLNAPGKFLIAAAEHDTPKRARAYLLTDQVVEDRRNYYAGLPPAARRSLPAGDRSSRTRRASRRNARWSNAGLDPTPKTSRAERRRPRGHPVGRAVPRSGRGHHRPRPDDRDRHEPPVDLPTPTRTAEQGHVIQVSRGRWRAVTGDDT